MIINYISHIWTELILWNQKRKAEAEVRMLESKYGPNWLERLTR
jgi:hypothetical protein